MRRIRSLAFVAFIFLFSFTLAACGGERKAEDLAAEIRTSMIAAQKLEMSLTISADYGDKVYTFGVNYTGNAANGQIEIRSPESVAGLTANVDVAQISLSYDDVTLDTGLVVSDGLAPVEAVPFMISQWQSGYITASGREKLGEIETVALTIYVSETEELRTWFDLQSLLPVRAELSDNGRMVIACDFENVILE